MSQPGFQKCFTKTFHKAPYSAISPTNPALSAAGKIILITAGGTGIGYAIANAFAQAQASHIILLSRRLSVLEAAQKELTTKYPSTKVHVYACSITDNTALSSVFNTIKSDIGRIDILVSSAVNHLRMFDVLETPTSLIHESFDTIVNGGLNVLKNFIENGEDLDPSREKVFINLATLTAHLNIPKLSTYSAAKSAFCTLLQHYHMEHHKSGLRIHSIHPGAIWTPGVEATGMPKDGIPWDDAGLPGGFCVWLASKQAEFLAGKFVWSNWDVEELMERKEEIVADEDLLRLGLVVGEHKLFVPTMVN